MVATKEQMTQESQTADVPASSKAASGSTSSDSSEYVPIQTAGGGDCAFHAALGVWDEHQRQFVCSDVAAKRQEVARIIIARKIDEVLFSSIKVDPVPG